MIKKLWVKHTEIAYRCNFITKELCAPSGRISGAGRTVLPTTVLTVPADIEVKIHLGTINVQALQSRRSVSRWSGLLQSGLKLQSRWVRIASANLLMLVQTFVMGWGFDRPSKVVRCASCTARETEWNARTCFWTQSPKIWLQLDRTAIYSTSWLPHVERFIESYHPLSCVVGLSVIK